MNLGHPSLSAPGSADLPGAPATGIDRAETCPTALRWAATQNAAGVVAILAGLGPEPARSATCDLPALVRGAGGWRKVLAEQGIDDLAAIMEPGIAALLAVQARDGSCAAAASALWHEFDSARTALLALVSITGPETPDRT